MALHSRQLLEQDESIAYCPTCTKTVPAWAEKCQFCGAPLPQNRGGHVDPEARTRRGGLKAAQIATGIWVMYYLSAAVLVLGGVYEAVAVQYGIGQPAGSLPLPMILGGLTAAFGIAVFIDSGFVRRIAASTAAIRLLLSILMMAGYMFGMIKVGSNSLYFMLLAGSYALAALLLAGAALNVAQVSKR